MVCGKGCHWCCWRPLQITNTKRTVLVWPAREGACVGGAFVRPECLGKAGQRAELHGDRGAEKHRKAWKSREDLRRVRSDGSGCVAVSARAAFATVLRPWSLFKVFPCVRKCNKEPSHLLPCPKACSAKEASAVLRMLAGQVARPFLFRVSSFAPCGYCRCKATYTMWRL